MNPPGRRQEDDINIVATLQGGGRRGCRIDAEGAAGGHLIPAVAPTLEAGANRTGGTRPPGTTVDTAETLIPFHVTQAPISGDVFPAMGTGNSQGCGTLGVAYNPYRTLEKDGTVTSGFAARPVVDALHGPTGNKEPLVVSAHSIAVRGREDGQEWELGDPEVGNALRAGDGGSSRGNWALTPQMAVRRLTPTECERLQGFPDGWTEGRSDSARYRLLGNAVCVSVSRWIARRIMEVES